MKSRIRLQFSDFWPTFDPRDNYFTRLLGDFYEIEFSDKPDFLIYSCCGHQFLRHRGIRIFYTGENLLPDFSQCDYAFSFTFCDHPNHMRLPHWRFRYRQYPLHSLPTHLALDPRSFLVKKTRFCNFVYSNKYCPTRNRFYRLLSRYKRVDAGGALFNNIGGRIGPLVSDKLEFLRPYKFSIAFENESYPGYTTEKLYEAMFADTLPIYWGDPLVHVDFNPSSFINYSDYGSLEALLQRVIEVDQRDELYFNYLRQDRFSRDALPEADFSEQLRRQFYRIFCANKTPVAQQPKPATYFIIHPVRRMASRLKQKSMRVAHKISYRINLARIEAITLK